VRCVESIGYTTKVHDLSVEDDTSYTANGVSVHNCIYPKRSKVPIKEGSLLTGPLEPTNIAYALAKICGIELCKAYKRQYKANFISVMPCNLYGPQDNYNLTTSHVLPALIRKFHEAKINNAKSVQVWGSGKPRREFMHADDCADACIRAMQVYNGDEHINIGTGKEVSIASLASTIANVISYEGDIVYDTSKPDGVMSKVLDITRMKKELDWTPSISLFSGIVNSYKNY